MQTDGTGRGVVNILAADKLMSSPKLYATLLLWLLSELFEQLPEVGDPEKPKLVFFFDEAHLLFNDAPAGAAREDRAGGAPDPLQGRRRLLRHAEPARHPGHGAGPARQPRAARAARLHAARPEGGQGRGDDAARQSRSSTSRQRSPSSAWARRWCRCSTRRAARRSSSAPSSCRPARRVGPITPRGARGAHQGVGARRRLRQDRRPRVGLREAHRSAWPAKRPPRETGPQHRQAAGGRRSPRAAAASWTRSAICSAARPDRAAAGAKARSKRRRRAPRARSARSSAGEIVRGFWDRLLAAAAGGSLW